MTGQLLALRFLCLAILAARSEPVPGRVPKVYNALITSNQNLEPSKAYPVYQPVLHDAFAFPLQPVFYGGDFALTNSLQPLPSLQPKAAPPQQAPTEQTEETPIENNTPSTEAPPTTPSATAVDSESESRPTPASPLPPNTESPIPLNQFGLPAQVLPLGRIDPAFDGFTQVGPFTYTYPGLRFYDPFDPFSYSPYANLPLYRPYPGLLAQNQLVRKAVAPEPPAQPSVQQTDPPSEPSDLNILNYSSKDPAIPNVPPPPLPQGGLKSDNSE